MKETNEDNTKEDEKENLIEEPKKEEAGPNPLSKLVSQSERKIDEEEKKRNEKLKEMSNSSFYYIKDYIFFFSSRPFCYDNYNCQDNRQYNVPRRK